MKKYIRYFLVLATSVILFSTLVKSQDFTFDVDSASCDGQAKIEVTIIPSTPPYSLYLYKPFPTLEKSIINITSLDTVFRGLDTASNYEILLVDGLGQKRGYLTPINQVIADSIRVNKGLSCYSSSDAQLEAFASGGQTPYSYQWNAAAGSQITKIATGLSRDATYRVDVSDKYGCSQSQISILFFYGINDSIPDPILISSIDSAKSCDGTDNGSITINAAGGTPDLDYAIVRMSDNDSTYQESNSFTSLSPNVYKTYVIDNKGCVEPGDNAGIGTHPVPAATAGSNSPVCEGTDIDLTESGGDASSWSWEGPNGFTSTAQNPTIATATLAADGSYTVTVTDGNGCPNTDNVNVTISTAPTATAGSNSPICEGDDLNLTETGGDGTNWNWSGPNGFTSSAQNPTIAAATAAAGGLYSVTVTDAGGCTNASTVNVTVNSAPSAIAGSNSPICEGENLNLTESGGDGTGWSWSGPNGFTSNQQNPSIVAAAPAATGLYTVTVTDAGGCTNSANVNVTVNDLPTATAGSNSPVCEGSNLNLTETGGDGTSWSWSGPNGFSSSAQNPTIASVTSAADGLYTVTVTDGNSCSNTSNVNVTINTAPTATAASNSPICEGENLNLTETGGDGTGWSWSGPNGFTSNQQNPSIASTTAAASGMYSVTVTDGNGCTNTDNVNVTVNTAPAATAGSNSPICEGENLNLTESGGDGTGWSWSGPNGFTSNQQNPTIVAATPAATGLYTVTVTDAGGCTNTANVNVTVNASPTSTAGSNSPVCEGNNINLTESGGDATSWSWSGPNSFSSNQQNPTIAGALPAAAGVYTVTVTDGNSCTNTDNVNVAVNNAPTVTPGSNSPICEGQNLNLTESGGDGTGWSWSGPNGFTSNQQNPTIVAATASATGLYTVTVTDAGGCTNTGNVNVTVNAAPAATAGSNSPICEGQNLNLNESGGDGTGWSWNGPNGFTSIQQNPTIASALPAATGLYTVIVTDGNGCTNTDNINVTVNAAPTATAGSNSPICEGENMNLTESGGDGTSWSWSGPNGFTSNQQNPVVAAATPAAGGLYTVTVTDAGGCTNTSNVNVTVNAAPTATAGSNAPICAGENLNLTENGGDGTGWSWSGPNGFTSNQQNPTIVSATVAASGLYTVTVTDGIGCENTTVVNVVVNALPSATAGSNAPICEGQNLNITETGGSGTAWSWSGPNGFTSNQQNPTIAAATSAAAGLYTVTVSDGNGCENTDNVNVTINSAPAINVNSNSPVCRGEDLNLTESGGDGTSWTWSGPASFSSNQQNPARVSVTLSMSGTYSVTVSDGNGCTNTGSTNVTINNLPNASAGSNSPICEGEDLNLFEFALAAVSWDWSGPDGFTSNQQNPTIATATAAAGGEYTVTVTDANGCKNTDNVTVSVIAAPSVTASSNSPVCEGSNLNLTENGGDAISWNWTGPNGFSSNQQNPNISSVTSAAAGVYTVVVSDFFGCSNTDNTTVIVYAAPSVTLGSNAPICEGEDLNLTESGGDGTSWNWSGPNGFSSNQQNPTVAAATPSASGNYNATVTDGNSCTSTSNINVTITPTPTVSVGSNSPICDGQDLNLTESGGDGTAWNWSGPNGFSSNQQNPTIATAGLAAAGLYTVTVTDAGGCENTGNTAVTVNTTPAVIANSNSPICEGQDLNLTETGGDATGWSWSGPDGFTSNQQNPTIAAATSSASGNYTITATDANSCSSSTNVNVTVNALPVVIANSNAPICQGQDLNLTETGGDATGWSWSGPDGFTSNLQNPSILAATAAATGNYDLTVTDGNGCENITSVSVIVNSLPVASILTNSPICAGQTIDITDGGGDATSWNWSGPNSYTSTQQNPLITNATVANAGNYYLTVSDGNGCENYDTAAVVVNGLPIPGILPNPANACTSDSLQLTVINVGGSGFYTTHSWTGAGATSLNATDIQNPKFYNSITGVFQLIYTVTDDNACSNSDTVDVTNSQGPEISKIPTITACYGDTIDITGADTAYSSSILWTSSGDGSFVENDVIEPRYIPGPMDLYQGTVTFYLTAFGNPPCAFITDSVAADIAPEFISAIGAPKPFDITDETIIEVCFTTSGHDFNYDLSYYLLAPDGQTSIALSNSPYTDFAFPEGRDAINLCFGTEYTDTLDRGSGLYPPGTDISGTFAAVGPWDSLFYKFNPAEGGWAVVLFDTLKTNVYKDGNIVEATINFTDTSDFTGKLTTISFESGAIAEPIIEMAKTAYRSPLGLRTSCFNTCDATAIVNIINGVGDPDNFTYTWNGPSTVPNVDSVDLCAGTYNLTVTDEVGCKTTTSVQVTSPPPIYIDSIFGYDSLLNCFGDTTIINIDANGGTGLLDYSINGGVDFYPDSSFTGLSGGLYPVVVQDERACREYDTVFIIEPAGLDKDTLVSNDVLCYGYQDGTIKIKINGGLPDYTYKLFKDTLLIDSVVTSVDSMLFDTLSGGNYKLRVTDGSVCVAMLEDTITISEPGVFAINSVTTMPSTFCDTTAGSITIENVSGGITPYQEYQTSSLDGVFDSTIVGGSPPIAFTGLSEATYALAIIDANGCEAHDTAIIVKQGGFNVDSVTVTEVSPCYSSNNGTVQLYASGGSGSFQYSDDNLNWQASNSFTNMPGGNNTLYIRDLNDPDCPWDSVIDIPAPAPILTAFSKTNFADTVKGAIQIIASGGNDSLFYGITNQRIEPAPYVKNFHDTLQLGELNTDVYSLSGETDTVLYLDLDTGTYYVSIKDTSYMKGTSCRIDTSFTIGLLGDLNVILTFIQQSTCPFNQPSIYNDGAFNLQLIEDGSIVPPVNLSITGRQTGYKQSTDSLIAYNQPYTNYPPDIYDVHIEDNTQPSPRVYDGVMTIPGPDRITINDVDTTNARCEITFGGEPDVGSITINNVSGGTPDYSYSWQHDPSNNTNKTENLSAGFYTIEIKDAANCYTNKTFEVISDTSNSVSVSLDTSRMKTCYGMAMDLQDKIDEVNALNYYWEQQDATEKSWIELIGSTIIPRTETMYRVIALDKNNCFASDTITIQLHERFNVIAGNASGLDTIEYTVGGIDEKIPADLYPIADAQATFAWSPATNLDLPNEKEVFFTIPDEPGEFPYNLAVTSNLGCTESDSVLVVVTKELYIPSGFTPNGDGYNDKWELAKPMSTKVEVYVYNRWGEKVHTYQGYESKVWDGKRNGKDVTIGVYYYVIISKNSGGGEIEKTGTITILR